MKTLEQGNYYSVEELLGFLSDNYQYNVLLQTQSKINLLTLPRSEKFIVTRILRQVFKKHTKTTFSA